MSPEFDNHLASALARRVGNEIREQGTKWQYALEEVGWLALFAAGVFIWICLT